MVKLVFCARRLPHLSRAEFQKYWYENHGPLVKKYAAVLGIRRYVQVHTVTSAFSEAMSRHRGAPDDFDGVAELWWDSVDDFARAGTTKEGRDAGRRLLEDEKRFIDLANSPLLVATERPVVDGDVR